MAGHDQFGGVGNFAAGVVPAYVGLGSAGLVYSGRFPGCGFGVGGGLSGFIIAGVDMHLVESDQRKCAFLREVNRATQARVHIHTARIEDMKSLEADVVTARALANLDTLLGYADIHRLSTGKCLFLKGKRWKEELTEAQKHWSMAALNHPSRTDSAGRILELSDLKRV